MAPPSLEVADIVRRKKAQYGHIVDSKKWDLLSNVILPSARMSFYEPDGKPTQVGKYINVFESRDEYVKQIGRFLEGGQTMHVFGYGDLEQTGPDEVKAVFSMNDTFFLNGSGGLIWSSGGGHYYERWVRQGDDWFVAELRLQRLNVNKSTLFWMVDRMIAFASLLGIDVSP